MSELAPAPNPGESEADYNTRCDRFVIEAQAKRIAELEARPSGIALHQMAADLAKAAHRIGELEAAAKSRREEYERLLRDSAALLIENEQLRLEIALVKAALAKIDEIDPPRWYPTENETPGEIARKALGQATS